MLRWLRARARFFTGIASGVRRRPMLSLVAVVATVAVVGVVASLLPPNGPTDRPGRHGVLQPEPAAADAAKPNIVFVLTDDLEWMNFSKFPNISKLMREGATFNNAVVTDSWCCPSRASMLRSQYVHSHKVYINRGPTGGYPEFVKRGYEKSTIGTWLQDAGYRTSYMGKYLNHYPKKYFGKTKKKDLYKTETPPGWDDWQVGGQTAYHGFNYYLHSNGKVRKYGNKEDDYFTDVMARKAASFIEETPSDKPFFLATAPFTPHLPATPAPRHKDAFKGVKAPRTPSFLQRNLTKEPAWMQRMPRMTGAQVAKMDLLYRKRLQSLLAIDDMVGTIMATLREQKRLDNTYFVFTSDNGYHSGQHGMPMGKTTAFEEDVRIPLIVRGPGVAPGSKVEQPVSAVDFGPTFVDLAGGKLPSFAEGTSLVPLLKGENPAWRKAVLVEFFARRLWNAAGPDCDERVLSFKGCPLPGSYAALRTSRYTYVEYVTGERQLYDRYNDPNQLNNIAPEADEDLLNDLSARLRSYAACKGEECRTAET